MRPGPGLCRLPGRAGRAEHREDKIGHGPEPAVTDSPRRHGGHGGSTVVSVPSVSPWWIGLRGQWLSGKDFRFISGIADYTAAIASISSFHRGSSS